MVGVVCGFTLRPGGESSAIIPVQNLSPTQPEYRQEAEQTCDHRIVECMPSAFAAVARTAVLWREPWRAQCASRDTMA